MNEKMQAIAQILRELCGTLSHTNYENRSNRTPEQMRIDRAFDDSNPAMWLETAHQATPQQQRSWSEQVKAATISKPKIGPNSPTEKIPDIARQAALRAAAHRMGAKERQPVGSSAVKPAVAPARPQTKPTIGFPMRDSRYADGDEADRMPWEKALRRGTVPATSAQPISIASMVQQRGTTPTGKKNARAPIPRPPLPRYLPQPKGSIPNSRYAGNGPYGGFDSYPEQQAARSRARGEHVSALEQIAGTSNLFHPKFKESLPHLRPDITKRMVTSETNPTARAAAKKSLRKPFTTKKDRAGGGPVPGTPAHQYYPGLQPPKLSLDWQEGATEPPEYNQRNSLSGQASYSDIPSGATSDTNGLDSWGKRMAYNCAMMSQQLAEIRGTPPAQYADSSWSDTGNSGQWRPARYDSQGRLVYASSEVTGDEHRAAKILGHLGGKSGGPARDKALTKHRKTQIAEMGAAARWKGNREKTWGK